MPIVALHRSEHAVLIGQNTAVAGWQEWSFDPPAEGYWIGRTGLRCYARPAGSVAVRVPPGATVEDLAVACDRCRECRGGRTVRRLLGRDAETVYRLAVAGEMGFRLEDTDVAKRRPGGPTLFGEESIDPMPTPGTVAPAPPNGGLPTEAQAVIDAGSMRLARIRDALRSEAYDLAAAKFDAKHEAEIAAAVPGIIPGALHPEDVATRLGDSSGHRADRLEAAIREALPWLDDEDPTMCRPLTARNILGAALGDGEARATS